MLNPVQLQALAEVVRTGSFTEAGKSLGYTSSAVSQQVSALERAIGMPLVVREAHRIRCTPAALRLAGRSTPALSYLAALEEDVRALATGRPGRLRIGTSLDPAAGLLAPTLRELNASLPHVVLTIEDAPPDDLVERVAGGSLDVALLYDYPAAPRNLPRSLARLVLGQEPWQLATPAGWPNGHVLHELATYDWFVGLDAGLGRRALSAVCAAAGFTPRISTASRNGDVVLGLVSVGLGVGVLPAARWPSSPEVCLRPFEAANATRRTLAVYQRRRTDDPVKVALRTLHRVAQTRRTA